MTIAFAVFCFILNNSQGYDFKRNANIDKDLNIKNYSLTFYVVL
jgi:hypothetical protein